MARLYSDENFPLPVVEQLRAMGHDVLTAQDAGNADAGVPDPDVIAYNRQDFIRLHRQNANHSGIIVCTENPDFASLAAKVDAAIKDNANLAGQLVRVNRGA